MIRLAIVLLLIGIGIIFYSIFNNSEKNQIETLRIMFNLRTREDVELRIKSMESELTNMFNNMEMESAEVKKRYETIKTQIELLNKLKLQIKQ